MSKQLFSKRAFLNKSGYHSVAAISTSIEEAEYLDSKLMGSYKISDCDRRIEISIDFDSMAELNNTLHKLDKIISVTQAFRDKIESLKPEIKNNLKKDTK